MDIVTAPRDAASCLERCPELIADALDRIGPRWAATLLTLLRHAPAPLRFNDLARRAAGITPKELSKNLRRLE